MPRAPLPGPAPKDHVLRIAPYVGGEAGAPGPVTPVKLSANENPHGPSPKAIEAFREAAGGLALYPDGGAAALREAIAAAEGLEAARIVCGAGSDEIISLLCLAYAGPGDTVVHSAHGFLMYSISALAVGAEPVAAPETDLRADVDALVAAADERTALLFIANPNNPTGTWLTGEELRRLREGLPARTLLVIDGAYAEYVDAPGYEDGTALVRERDDVVLTRTFSKIHGLAAVRLGWAYGPERVIDALGRVRGPFNVSVPAQAAGAAAIADRDRIAWSKAENAAWRDRLVQALGGIGIPCTPSQGNFLLLQFEAEGRRSAASADAYLKARGLILRRMEGYGLPDRLRLSIGREYDNRAVIAALTEFMAEGQSHSD